MVEYCIVNAKLSNLQLSQLKTAVKNSEGTSNKELAIKNKQ